MLSSPLCCPQSLTMPWAKTMHSRNRHKKTLSVFWRWILLWSSVLGFEYATKDRMFLAWWCRRSFPIFLFLFCCLFFPWFYGLRCECHSARTLIRIDSFRLLKYFVDELPSHQLDLSWFQLVRPQANSYLYTVEIISQLQASTYTICGDKSECPLSISNTKSNIPAWKKPDFKAIWVWLE